MTAETEVRTAEEVEVVVSKLEIEEEEKRGLDINSLHQDLPKVGADCNSINHRHDADGNGRDDPDNSYVFVNGSDGVSDDPIDKLVNAGNVTPESKLGSPNKDFEVQVQPCADENTCIADKTDVSFSNNDDVAAEDSLPKPSRDGDGDGNGNVNGTDAVEKETETLVVGLEPQQLDAGVKFKERNELQSALFPEEKQVAISEFAAELEDTGESRVVSSEAVDSTDGKMNSEEHNNNLDAIAESGESQESQNMVFKPAVCKSPAVEVGEVKSDGQTKLESAKEVEESFESDVIITKSDETRSSQPDHAEEKLKEGDVIDLDPDVNQNSQAQIVVTDINGSGSSEQGHEAKKVVNETCAALETQTDSSPVSDENKDCLPLSHECMADGQKASELKGYSENAKILPILANSVRSEIEIENLAIESEESFPAGSCEGTIIDQEVGYGASTITENLPTCAANDIKADAEVENSDIKNKECPVSNAKSEIEVENNPVGGDSTSSCPSNDVSSETEVGLGSIDPEEVPTSQCDDVHIESEVSDRHNECAHRESIFATGLEAKCESFQNGSSSDMKSESEVETSSAIRSRDTCNNDAAVSESEDLNGLVSEIEGGLNSVPESAGVGNVGDQVNGGDGVSDNKLLCQENEDTEAIQRGGISTSSLEGSSANAIDGQNVAAAATRPFHVLIRVPRFDDEKLRELIRFAQLKVDEKTQFRDAIRVEIQKKRANCQSHGDSYELAKSEDRAARRLVKSKRQEIDSVRSVINRVKNAISVEDIDGRMCKMEHMIEHETLPLKEEKQFIREIKQLKHLREQLSSNMGSQDEVQQALDQKDQIEERLKILKKELDCLKDRVSKAEAAAAAAGKKYDDERKKLAELQSQFRAADDVRQEAYTHLLSLKRLLFEKNKYFRMYKDDAVAANDYALSGDGRALHRLCANQVETIMELWNENDEFRKEYVRCNTRSTLRRLRTLDGRSLGPDEEPPVLPSFVDERVDRSLSSSGKVDSFTSVSALEETKQVSSLEDAEADAKSTVKVAVQNNETAKTKKPAKPILENGSASVSSRDVTQETKEEEHMQTKEERELARQAEELKKEEAAAKLKEQHQLEEKAKAKEALERKKRNAEKAQIRAELRAQKEAEQKEKEREKRLRKKERKKAAAADISDGGTNDGEAAPTSESAAETIKEPEIKETPIVITKRPQNSSQFTKQSKIKSIPPPLRNRGKRRMQQWMWVMLTVAVVMALFLLGNGNLSFNLGLRRFGF